MSTSPDELVTDEAAHELRAELAGGDAAGGLEPAAREMLEAPALR